MEKQIVVKCIDDNKFECDRKIVHSCNNEFALSRENIFYVETSIYEDYVIGQYYTVCPVCGYMVCLDKEILPDELKISAKNTNKEDPLEFRKNELKSQLINLNYITPKVKRRVMW